MNKGVILSLLLAATTALAQPSVSVLYENNNAMEVEGVNTQLSAKAGKLEVGANVFANEDRVHSYGVSVGVPLKEFYKVTLTPFAGVEHYRVRDKAVGSIGIGAKYRILNSSVFLDGRAKYAFELSDKDNKVEDAVYSIGLTKQF